MTALTQVIFLGLGIVIGWMMRGWKIKWNNKQWSKTREE